MASGGKCKRKSHHVGLFFLQNEAADAVKKFRAKHGFTGFPWRAAMNYYAFHIGDYKAPHAAPDADGRPDLSPDA